MVNDDETLIAEEYYVDVLRLAIATLALLDPPSPGRTMNGLRDVRERLESVELASVAMLTVGGHSWAALADQMDVTRQSLHRRLSRKVMMRLSTLREVSAEPRRREGDQIARRLQDRIAEIVATPVPYAGRALASQAANGRSAAVE